MPRDADFPNPWDLLVNDDSCLTLATFRTLSGIIQATETLPSDDDSLQQYAGFSDNGYQIINSDCVGFLTTSDDAAGQGSGCRNKPITDGGGGGGDADDNDLDQLCAWEKMTTLSQYIDEYSDNAGAEDSGNSCYGLMLREHAIIIKPTTLRPRRWLRMQTDEQVIKVHVHLYGIMATMKAGSLLTPSVESKT
ncbi:hypothetical protein BO82DRAFT_400751 [Aspergillus uvarum CBS 121591]|uniref:Uncharacterized protein n=1 Tax=Aspergillus uvarum CBS 121591 TaxID=1448315 RepID=A0A319DWS9_9EURO|nr:hypothetical protein BO82DRAFT_400751 [Aspergillus uvarum CBS 121591]PYH83362.1 hypothetical protein BO82DRAFT_400751 [Aspergillus uvarum CBS 121591]